MAAEPRAALADWERLLPETRARPAPRPLPVWVRSLEFGAHAEPMAYDAEPTVLSSATAMPPTPPSPPPAVPHPTVPRHAAAGVAPAAAAGAVLTTTAEELLPLPPAPLPLQMPPIPTAAELPPPTLPCRAHATPAKPPPTTIEEFSSPASVMETDVARPSASKKVPSAPGVAPSSVEEATAAAAMRSELAAIERQLRRYARERDEHAAAEALHIRLSAQVDTASAESLSQMQRRAVHEALLRVRERLDTYAATETERHHAVSQLASRIAELRE